MAEHRFSRRFPRRRFKYDVGLLHRGTYQIVSGLEIGEGGMLVKFPDVVKEGDKISLSFFIPLKGYICVNGEVVYQKPELSGTEESISMGMKFLDLEFESKRHIRDYIALKSALEAVEEAQK